MLRAGSGFSLRRDGWSGSKCAVNMQWGVAVDYEEKSIAFTNRHTCNAAELISAAARG
jgi:hypothetical protein